MLKEKTISVMARPSTDSITVQIIEDSIVVGCNHDGAETDEVSSVRFDPDSQELVNDSSFEALVCDKCNAWYDGGEWNE